ncbi:hypothetical protein PHK61_11735 [Actinomycetospora lutea]|uniref:hypothetical protein n=1 Tax=Actinomycetospora lutea TaxID=663604 RepID=UPI0023673E12|nr:hypothetical protein [Actinomycetospora lutea]MDD7939086.1 hypothetical protein [Actinomycetospora lutea]
MSTANSKPWAATLIARLVRARDVDVLEVIEGRHGEFTRRLVGHRGPVASPVEVLDADARRELLSDLRDELAAPPVDVDAADLEEFAAMLERSLTDEMAAAG